MNRPPSSRTPVAPATPAPLPVAPPAPTRADVLVVEGSLFWDRYKLPIVAAAALLVLALIGFEFFALQQEKEWKAAGASLDSAKTPADYRHVISAYPGTMAAANATLLLGQSQFAAKDFAGAGRTFQEFADKFPKNPLAPVALLGAAEALEEQNQPDAARAAFERETASYPASYATPLARLDEALLLKALHKTEEARHIYENIMAAGPETDAAQQASEELRFLKVVPGPPGYVPSPTPAPSATPAVSPAAAVPFAAPAPTAAGPLPAAMVVAPSVSPAMTPPAK